MQELPEVDVTLVDPGRHDLSYLEGAPSTNSGQSAEPRRYFEGLSENARALGISKTDLLQSDAESPFHSIVSATSDHSHLPVSLQPTIIQHRYSHHPFFDCIPIPSFRDRVILAAATKPPLVNRFVICFDMFAGGLNFVGDSTAEQSWTFSDEFLGKWGRLLDFDLVELQKRADQSPSS